MLPLRLNISNFLSYGHPPVELDYTRFHIACVTGENGHGKSSAIVDAVTFALWGQARGTDARGAGLDDLIRLGADEMALEFEFELDGQVYRVLRKRWRGKATSLEFHVRDGETWHPLTAERIQETQERLNRFLRLDYQTFVHSAFVLQGKADAFTVAKPNERKQILAEVLGLAEYEERERLVREKALAQTRLMEQLDRELAELAVQLEETPTVREELTRLEAALTATDQTLTEAHATQAGLEARKNQLELDRVRMEDLQRRRESAEREQVELAETMGKIETRMAAYQQLLDQAAAIEVGFAAWEEARRQAESLAGQAQAYYALSARRNEQAAVIAAETRRLQGELDRLRREQAQEETKAARLQVTRERLADFDLALSRLEPARVERARLEERLDALQRELAQQRAALTAREQERDDLRERYRRIKETAGTAECPLCRSALDDARRDGLLAQIKAEGTTAATAADDLQKSIAALEAEQTACQQAMAQRQRELAQEPQLAVARANAERDAADATGAAENAATLAAQAEALAAALTGGGFAGEARQALAAVEAELAQLAYDQSAHQSAIAREEALRPHREQLAQLQLARQSRAKDAELLESYRQQLESRRQVAGTEEELLTALARQVSELPSLQKELDTISARVTALEAEEKSLLAQRASAQTRLEALESAGRKKDEKVTQRAEAARERGYWAELTQAYGRKGIQALIIENAIPELEKEANHLLSRWTEGRLHITLITQGETRSGTVTETLDIAIADELGTRKYEMFSGGEKFRVDLALRVGLSKLLAKRAGARLRILVIDEGFGTQDATGIERLIEALNDLRDEFDKILIVTHHPEMKDRFPVHIEVVKSPETGSRLTLHS